MQHVVSTHLFANHRLTTRWLERIRDCGFAAIELFCARQHIDYHNRAQLTELGHWFRESPLTVHSLHAPIYSDEVWGRSGPDAVLNIAETVKARRIRAVDEIKRALEIADLIPFRYLVQHVGVSGEEWDQQKADAAFTSLDELRVFAGQRGVEILIENIPNELSTAARLVQFLRQTHLAIQFCFDVGHAHMHGSIEAEFQRMEDRIRSTHIHDNDGRHDLHLFPLGGGGTIDWRRVMPLLRSRSDQYPLLLELKEDRAVEDPLAAAKQICDQLDHLYE